MGYGRYVEDRSGDLRKAEILEALGFQEAFPLDLLKRLTELYQLMRQGTGDEESMVTLSTIHSSKGLEYPHVILMDVVDGILPKVPSVPSDHPDFDAYQEERRLFYVAMTRAKDELWILSYKGQELPSAFIQELFPPVSPKEQEAKVHAAMFHPGVKVLHKKYGEGSILALSQDIVTIAFSQAGEKKFSLSTIVKNGLLAKV